MSKESAELSLEEAFKTSAPAGTPGGEELPVDAAFGGTDTRSRTDKTYYDTRHSAKRDLAGLKEQVGKAFTGKEIKEKWHDSWTYNLFQTAADALVTDVAVLAGDKAVLGEQEKEFAARRASARKKGIDPDKTVGAKLGEIPGELGQTAKAFKKAPLTTSFMIGEGLIYDAPLFIGTGGLAVPARLASVTAKLGASERAIKASKVAGVGIEAGGVGAAGEAAREHVQEGEATLGGAAKGAGNMLLLDVGARALKLLHTRKGEAGRVEGEHLPEEPMEYVNVPGKGPSESREVGRPGETPLEFVGRDEPTPWPQDRPTPTENVEARALFENDADYGQYLVEHHDQVAQKEARPAIANAVEDIKKASEDIKKEVNESGGQLKEVSAGEVQRILSKDPGERTAAENATLKKWQFMGMFAAGGGMALMYSIADDDLKEKFVAAGLMASMPYEFSKAKPIGSLLRDMKYGSRVLERLPQNTFKFKRATLEQEINKPDVPKAEKELFQRFMEEHPEDEFRALDLAKALEGETEKFDLKPEHTEKFAEYGVDNIRPPSAQMTGGSVQEVRSTVWKLPEEWGIPASGHFTEMGGNQFGHTRAFEEDGVTHVVEMQSDLLQHQKELTPEKVEALKANIEAAKRALKELETKFEDAADAYAKAQAGEIQEYSMATYASEMRNLRSRMTRQNAIIFESEAELSAARGKALGPVAKQWPRRLVQEELGLARQRGKDRVRFATADTVAKVEGWPRRFETYPGASDNFQEPGHQSIYDRYKDETTKYLKSLGGKEVKDSRGHGWIEVPTPRVPPRAYGFSQPALLAVMTGAGLGYLIGSQGDPESPIRAGLYGLAIGALAGRVAFKGAENLAVGWQGRLARKGAESMRPGAMKEAAKKVASKIPGGKEAPEAKPRTRINEAIDNHQTRIGRAARDVMQMARYVVGRVPSAERREQITRALDGEMVALTKGEREVYEKVKAKLKEVGDEAVRLGVLDELRENYVTHFVKRGQEKKLADYLKSIRGGPSMSPESRFAEKRIFPTIKDLEKAGFELETKDAAGIYAKYKMAMARTLANAELLEALTKDSRRIFLDVAKDKNIPEGYVSVDRPMLLGKKVHPDIVPEMKFLFDTRDPDGWVKAASALSTVAKRAEVSFSLFHAVALTQAFIGSQGKITHGLAGAAVGAAAGAALGDPYEGALFGFAAGMGLPAAVRAAKFSAGKDSIIKQIREGGIGDEVDTAIKDGLKFSVEKMDPAAVEMGQDFYAGMSSLQEGLDKYVHPVAGKAVEKVAAVNHAVDNWMWGRLHAGMKMSVYMDKKAKLLKDSVKAHERSPDAPLLGEKQAGEIAAHYTNTLFGGLNWVKLMEGVNNQTGRQIASAMTSPTGMRYLNLLTFAPDWTVSTTASALRAFDIRPSQAELSGLHRQYMIRAALWTFALGEAINYAASGHHLWENEDWTTVDLGDGDSMQLSKHFFEPFHWVQKPGQEILNKLGAVPSEALEQAMGKQYLSTKGAPPLSGVGARAGHLAKRMLPFGATNLPQSLGGTLGVPIYHHATKEERAEQRKKKKTSKQYLEDVE